MDDTTTIAQLKNAIGAVVKEREWQQFHTPKNLSMNLSIEANELMEKFLWLTTEQSIHEIDKNRQEIEDEISDVFLTILLLCNATKTDLSSAFLHKLEKIKKRYPIEACKGKPNKYDKL